MSDSTSLPNLSRDPAHGLVPDPADLLRNLSDHIVLLDEDFRIQYLNHAYPGPDGRSSISAICLRTGQSPSRVRTLPGTGRRNSA